VMRDLDRPRGPVPRLAVPRHRQGSRRGPLGAGRDMVRDIAARLPLNEDDVSQWEFPRAPAPADVAPWPSTATPTIPTCSPSSPAPAAASRT
jgi:hypothetical protein